MSRKNKADTNRRAFLYFNKEVEGFQDDENLDDNKGWNFTVNRFPDGIGVNAKEDYGLDISYVNYQNPAHVLSLQQLRLRPKWYDFFDPFGTNGIGFYNAYRYNKKKN